MKERERGCFKDKVVGGGLFCQSRHMVLVEEMELI